MIGLSVSYTLDSDEEKANKLLQPFLIKESHLSLIGSHVPRNADCRRPLSPGRKRRYVRRLS